MAKHRASSRQPKLPRDMRGAPQHRAAMGQWFLSPWLGIVALWVALNVLTPKLN